MTDPLSNPVKTTLISIASAALEEGLSNFLLMGGNAIIFYGVPRFTQDIDFLIPEGDSLAWRLFLEKHAYRFGHGTEGFQQFFPMHPGQPRIDLMLVNGSTWEKLRDAALQQTVVDGLDLQLPAPKHLIAMKLSSATDPARTRPDQDWEDVTELIKRCNLDLEDPELRKLVVRYGGEEALVKLRTKLSSRP